MDYDKLEVNHLIQRLASFFISVIILIIINAIITHLPSMDTLVFRRITIASIASAVILVIIIGLVLTFGQDIANRVVRIFPSYPEANPLINTLSILVSIIIAYKAFNKILVPFLAQINLTWLYPLLFLCIAIFPIYKITTLLVASSGKIADVFMVGRQATASLNTIACPACGNLVPDSKFCNLCGKEIIKEKDSSANCQKCGREIKPGVNFCINCGASTASTESPVEKVVVGSTCTKCNTSVEPDDKFCLNCGAEISES